MFMHQLHTLNSTANVWVLCEQLEVVSPGQRPRIVVGTPETLETVLMTSPTAENDDELGLDLIDVEALVVDEIHNLSKSASMERLIHMLPQAFVLGLSATMGNPSHLHEWLVSLKKGLPVHLEVVTQRFFNLQQHVFNDGELTPISPLAAITPETLAIASKTDIPFTPFETVRLFNTIRPHLDDAAKQALNPSAFFAAAMARDGLGRLSLGQAREYGRELVTALSNLSAEAKQAVFGAFHLKEISQNIDLYNLVNKLRNRRGDKDMLPALAFSLDSVTCYHAFHELLQRLVYEEDKAHPNRRARLQRLAREYERAIQKWENTYDRLNSDAARMDYERDNPRPSPPEEEDKPHANFVVGRPLITNSDIQGLWDSLCDTVTESYFDKCRKDIKDFIKPYVEGLRRGIALYTKDMPVFYLRHVQRLAQNGSLGLVVSDSSLAHGVNMPFRTVVFHGDHTDLTPLMVQQMAGRAGRRGLDRSGHVVYMGFTSARVTQLMSVSSPDVIGTDVRNPMVAALSTLSGGQSDRYILTGLLSTFFNPLFQYREGLGRTPEDEAAHKTSCTQRVGEARRIVEQVPQEFRRILFALRDIPVALQLCAVVLPKLFPLDIELRRGMDTEPLQLFNVIGRYLESRPGATAHWDRPALPWSQKLLKDIEAELAACKAASADFPPLPVPPSDDVYRAVKDNSVLGVCGTARARDSAAEQPAFTPTSSTPVSTSAVSADGGDDAGKEVDDVDDDVDGDIGAVAQDAPTALQPFAYKPPLGDLDMAHLFDVKQRLQDVMNVLLTIRNECAKRSRDSRPWLNPSDAVLVGWAKNEIYLRVLFRRIYYMILEYPF
jgi:hypothetical protein